MDPVTGAVVIAGLKYVGTPAADVVKEFLNKVLAPPGTAIGKALAHPIVEWQKRRVERANRLVLDAAQIVADSGQEPQPVPGRLLMPILEKASLEEDDDLSRRWVALLANSSLDPQGILPSFLSILGELSSLEARVLDHVYRTCVEVEFVRFTARKMGTFHESAKEFALKRGLADKAITEDFQITSSDTWRILTDNLERLRLVHCGPDYGYSDEPEGHEWGVRITDFGKAFVRSCVAPRNRQEPEPTQN